MKGNNMWWIIAIIAILLGWFIGNKMGNSMLTEKQKEIITLQEKIKGYDKAIQEERDLRLTSERKLNELKGLIKKKAQEVKDTKPPITMEEAKKTFEGYGYKPEIREIK